MKATPFIAGGLMVTLLAFTIVGISAPSLAPLLILEGVLWVLVGLGGRELARMAPHPEGG